MARELKSNEMFTGLVRVNFPSLLEPKAFNNGDEPKYSVQLMIPAEDEEVIGKIKETIRAALKEQAHKFKGGKIPKEGLRIPLREGWTDDRYEGNPDYDGMYILNANSLYKPRVEDIDGQLILDENEIYAGCWGIAKISFYCYNFAGNQGVAVGIQGFKKIKDDQEIDATGGSSTFSEVSVDQYRKEAAASRTSRPVSAKTGEDDIFSGLGSSSTITRRQTKKAEQPQAQEEEDDLPFN